MAALKFSDLQNLANRIVRELSMGQRKRAIFAAVLVGIPKYILLDEPLEGMNRNIQKEILVWVYCHVEAGTLVVVVSPFIEPFINLVSEAVTIKNGYADTLNKRPAALDNRLTLLENLARGKLFQDSNKHHKGIQ